MDTKKHVGTFHSIDTALYKITELLAKGHPEKEIFAVIRDEVDFQTLKGQTNIELIYAQGENWKDKLQLFLNGEEPMGDALERMGISLHHARMNINDLNDGAIVLFVDNSPDNEVTEMDSSAALGVGGEPLDGQGEDQQILEGENTVPRINTTNL